MVPLNLDKNSGEVQTINIMQGHRLEIAAAASFQNGLNRNKPSMQSLLSLNPDESPYNSVKDDGKICNYHKQEEFDYALLGN